MLEDPKKRDKEGNEKLCAIFKKVDFIKNLKLKDEHLVDITANLTYQFIAKGQRVIEYGDEGDQMFFIISGAVDVIKPVELKKN